MIHVKNKKDSTAITRGARRLDGARSFSEGPPTPHRAECASQRARQRASCASCRAQRVPDPSLRRGGSKRSEAHAQGAQLPRCGGKKENFF